VSIVRKLERPSKRARLYDAGLHSDRLASLFQHAPQNLA
jgi:hypothetical protein